MNHWFNSGVAISFGSLFAYFLDRDSTLIYALPAGIVALLIGLNKYNKEQKPGA
jgi:hypothetical protein